MNLFQIALVTFLLLPVVVSAQLDSNFISAIQIALLSIAAGASLITVIMVAELFKILTKGPTKVSGELEKCPKCGKNSLAKTYDGQLLTSYVCKKCRYEEIKEKPKSK